MIATYYFRTPESQESYPEELRKFTSEAESEKGGFAKAALASPCAELPEDLGTSAVSSITGSACPSVYNPSALSTLTTKYQAKSGRAARKPIRHLKHDQTLSTPQLLKFKPLRPWDKLRPNERLALIAQSVILADAVAFTLNFSRSMERKLRTANDGARKLLSDDMRRQLRRCFDIVPEMSFIFEFDDDERLHAHGIAILSDHTSNTLAKFRQALKQAGGVIHGAAAGYQVKVKRLYSDFWRTYMTMDAARTVELLGTDKIAYTSQSMSRLAKEVHEAELARDKARKTRAKPATNAESTAETHTESSAPVPAPTHPKPAHDSPRPPMADPAIKGLPASFIAEVEVLLDGL